MLSEESCKQDQQQDEVTHPQEEASHRIPLSGRPTLRTGLQLAQKGLQFFLHILI